MSEWKPIDTAPRDRDVLLWWPHWRSRPVIGSWQRYRECWASDDAPSDSRDYPQPTRWQPLPDPPEDA